MKSTLSNGKLTAEIRHKGAELASLRNNALNLEYIWPADPRFWGKSSPVLFPIVGQLKENTYKFGGRSYSLPRHGFAREMDFQLESIAQDRATFILRSSEESKLRYPFDFELRISYVLTPDELAVEYSVHSTADQDMLFSLGAHPAFNVPLIPGTKYADYYLLFSERETSPRWNISPEGLIESTNEPFLLDQDRLDLTKELFSRDALVFKDLKSDVVSIRCSGHDHGIRFSFPGFPYFAIWAAPGADFVCLEPWFGIADSVGHDQQLKNKEGVIQLARDHRWSCSWSVSCF